MRKKSHIALAGFLVREMDDANMQKHWKAFYFGSILPDLTPKMITDPHEFDSSYLELKRRIAKLLSEAREHACKEGTLFCRLGVVMHYLADYFTFPHNKTYPGSLKDHCAYEEKLKQDLRAFLKTEKAKQIGREKDRDFASLEELFSYVKQQHEAYLKKRSNVEKDIEHIVVINRQLVDAIAQLFHNHKSHHKMA